MAVIAVDCGGTNLVYGRYESDGRGEPAGKRPTPRAAAAIPQAIAEAVAPLLVRGISAIGIGTAGLVDHATRTLVWSPHASGGGVALGAEVAVATGVPVVVDNDANLAALAEARLGAGVGYRMMLFVGLGTGIGGGLAIEGTVERGRGFLGEMGHLTLDPSGPLCACGRRGCWEALVSGTALDVVCARRLMSGDPGGHMRQALAAFPIPAMALRVMKRYYIHGGKAGDEAFRAVPRFTVTPPVALQELTVVGAFCEVWLAKQEHSGPVGINFLRKIEIPLPFGLLGAMLAGVDYVLIGAGNPAEIPAVIRALSRGEDVEFGIEGSRLFILQARPVATFLSLLREAVERRPPRVAAEDGAAVLAGEGVRS